MVNFDDDDLAAAYYCAAAVIRSRQLRGQPIPAELRLHFERLQRATQSVSESGHESSSDSPQSEPDELITARQAATILGLTKRQTQRLAADLDGRIIDGRWLFQRNTVETYVAERGIA